MCLLDETVSQVSDAAHGPLIFLYRGGIQVCSNTGPDPFPKEIKK